MTTKTITGELSTETNFKTAQVAPIIAGHFVHDLYTAFIAPLLPVIIDKFSLSLTRAGSLNAIMQLPAVINPFIGYLADKVSLRYFIILAPGVTATLISFMGFAPNYLSLVIMLFAVGISIAAFHAPAPAMIGRVAGRQVGLGMSMFMAAGETARMIGPLVAVWAITTWSLEGFWRVVVLGWAASFFLFLRLRNLSARPAKPNSLRSIIPMLRSLFLPLVFFFLFRNILQEAITTFLPTYMTSRGASLWMSGASLTILEGAGVVGALLSGPVSDRLGRRSVLAATTVLPAILLLIFINTAGWLQIAALIILGFTALSGTPVTLALVQEQMPENRAVGNGLLMFVSFLLRPIGTLFIGLFGDHFGLQAAFTWGAVISLLSLPAVFFLPETRKAKE